MMCGIDIQPHVENHPEAQQIVKLIYTRHAHVSWHLSNIKDPHVMLMFRSRKIGTRTTHEHAKKPTH